MAPAEAATNTRMTNATSMLMNLILFRRVLVVCGTPNENASQYSPIGRDVNDSVNLKSGPPMQPLIPKGLRGKTFQAQHSKEVEGNTLKIRGLLASQVGCETHSRSSLHHPKHRSESTNS